MDSLARVRASSENRRAAESAYRAAILSAVDGLELDGARDAYARVATAAGVSKQAVRALVVRARGAPPAGSSTGGTTAVRARGRPPPARGPAAEPEPPARRRGRSGLPTGSRRDAEP